MDTTKNHKKSLVSLSNFLILVLSFFIFYFVFDKDKISTNVLDLFPKVEQRELLDIHTDLESSNQILLYLGADSSADSAESNKNNKDSTNNPNPHLETLKRLNSVESITLLKDNIYIMSIDKDIKMEDFYIDFEREISKIPDSRYFSAEILRVENTNAIFENVSRITIFSVVFLVVLYLFILRIPFLSLNTFITIASANLLGISAITLLFDNINIMSLQFGVAIGNLAIDYMLHHHFFRLYMHKFSFNKSVFYGFITTFLGFGICLFVPFPLLQQLSLYAMVCLLVSYLSFGFVYQYVGFKKPIFYRNLRHLRKPRLNNRIVLGISILIFAITLPNLELDYNLERLDYDNKARLSDKDFFISKLGDSHSILIRAKNEADLGDKALQVAQLLESPQMLKSDIRNLKSIEKNGEFWAKINIDSKQNLSKIKDLDFTQTRSVKELSDEITSGIYAPMLKILSLVIVSMIVVVLLVTRSLVSFSYTIVPLSAISLFLLSTEVNIMHLFSLLIVVVSSVDYGIYVEKEGENIRTLHAIIFSALTTIAGFGFLSFSSILALKSFGLTITIGLVVILALLLYQKRHIKKGV